MSDVTTIQALQRSINDGPAWHGPAVIPLLADVDATQAAAKSGSGAHSIWEILLHMNAWQEYTVRALQHQEVSSLEGAEDWPTVDDPTEERWQAAIDRFKKSAKKIRDLLDNYDNAALREMVPGRDHSMKVLLHGISHHNAYHAGQIALLKRMAT